MNEHIAMGILICSFLAFIGMMINITIMVINTNEERSYQIDSRHSAERAQAEAEWLRYATNWKDKFKEPVPRQHDHICSEQKQ